jgi:hypothetical protein
MNKGYYSNSTNLINIYIKKRDLKIEGEKGERRRREKRER